VRGELERSRAGETSEAKARDEWRRKSEEAETQLRLERAGRADEGRLAREKLGQQEVRRRRREREKERMGERKREREKRERRKRRENERKRERERT
jgi:hypothetical protein